MNRLYSKRLFVSPFGSQASIKYWVLFQPGIKKTCTIQFLLYISGGHAIIPGRDNTGWGGVQNGAHSASQYTMLQKHTYVFHHKLTLF